MTVGKILGINMVISTVRNVEPNGENIICSLSQSQMMLLLTPQSCQKMLNFQQE